MKGYIQIIFLLIFIESYAQEKAVVYGYIKDENGKEIESVSVSAKGYAGGTITNEKGYYRLTIPAEKNITLVFSFVGYETKFLNIELKSGEEFLYDLVLYIDAVTISTVKIEAEGNRENPYIRLDPKEISVLPSTTGGVEALIKTMPGVSTNSELSSQYSVRGGNYDENLVYVNDVEIYRPILVRTGQQEGLSFLYPEMVSSILFSAGGFEAKYGDKLSSVLDIKYRSPKEFSGYVSASLLGTSILIEDNFLHKRGSYMLGFRQKSNQYLLGSLDTKGEYKPSFSDFQTKVDYEFSDKWKIELLGNYSRNKYNLLPQTRETEFGTVNEAYKLTIYFEGQEADQFETWLGAFSTIFMPNDKLTLKLITSAFNTYEEETYDILGVYSLGALERDFGSDELGDVIYQTGAGAILSHARNYLEANVLSVAHKGIYSLKNNYIQWGLTYKKEQIYDQINEWEYLDSAGYSIPQSPYDSVNLFYHFNSKNTLISNRYSGYVQNIFSFNDSSVFRLTAGCRFHYWDFNDQLLVSPRATFSIKPHWEKDFLFRLSSGYYYQPPFYKEVRGLDGELHSEVKAQKAVHFVAGSDWNFKAWNRPFKIVAETYYKTLSDLNTYSIDNVRIRYYANNEGSGYAKGFDFRINGEFVKGIESWLGFSVMETVEVFENYYKQLLINSKGEIIIPGYTYDQLAVDTVNLAIGYLPRPMDQRVTVNLFFQDYLPRIPACQVHINLLFGSGFPIDYPDFERYKDVLRYPFYRRVDVGFSYTIKDEDDQLPNKNPLKYFDRIWLGLEIFNLLDINNTVSYYWIKDIYNRQYAIPNYLTPRLINVKLHTKF